MLRGRSHASWLRQLVLSEGYGHDGPGFCLGKGRTEAEGVPSQGGRGDTLLRRKPPNLTYILKHTFLEHDLSCKVSSITYLADHE